ncbi:hypothetical protein SAMN05192534_10222 [Alteribacillus persepolensis]|uniref:Uncharacterized protein n=1 Tax=Alteribacillus persepolensis TaxID=568899 RepID=A0A1G8A4Y2_9BACI|nr:hypothetical protein [Alteribacillus persepolensis]SDH15916.1 hypothetical protein SAMN05192534_10222 [Alteribacillus persepolensis]
MTYSAAKHILFAEKRETFAQSFEILANKLIEHDIDISLLDDVVDAVQEVEELTADAAFENGYKKGWYNGKAHTQYDTYREELKKETIIP